MLKLNVHVFDHASFMSEITQLLEDILGRPVYEIEDWRRVVTEARQELNRMRQPVAEDSYPHEFPFV